MGVLYSVLRQGTAIGISITCLTACSASITIVHRDPTYSRIEVAVDGRDRKVVDFGDDVSFSVTEESHHVVRAVPLGRDNCPWTQDGKGWTMWVDKDAILTLLPVSKYEECDACDKEEILPRTERSSRGVE